MYGCKVDTILEFNPIPLTSFNDENAKCHNFDNFDPNKCVNDFELELFKIFQGKKILTIGSRVMGRRNKQGGLSGPPLSGIIGLVLNWVKWGKSISKVPFF